ncbi:MAG: histidine kinase [Pseudomonadota bacterium]
MEDEKPFGSATKFAEFTSVRYFSRGLLLLVFLPILNTTLAVLFTSSISGLDWALIPHVGLRLWLITGVMFLVVYLLERGPVPPDATLSTAQFVVKYCLVFFISMALMVAITLTFLGQQSAEYRTAPMGPVLIAMFEILLVAAMRSVLHQQQVNLALVLSNRNAQFHMLRAQLNPHFLFNSLNLISSEIEHNPTLAAELIDKLSHLMRGALAATERPTISLGEELGLLEQYLEIQQARFGERLKFRVERAEADSNLPVPPMISQPLVENAIKHGIVPLKKGGTVCVQVSANEGVLQLCVKDDGAGFEQDSVQFGHGLNLVKDSVELLYASDLAQAKDCFQIRSKPGEGTVVELRLPIVAKSEITAE